MGFFEALKRVLSHDAHPVANPETQKRIRDAWGLDDEQDTSKADDAHPTSGARTGEASAYDRAQWAKKLKRILDDLPDSRDHWQTLMTEAHALNLEPEWISQRQREEFALLVRRAVSDRLVSEEDHHTLEQARKLIGMTEAEAETILHKIMAEAEKFFGTPVKDEE
jgi:hypothetical protein